MVGGEVIGAGADIMVAAVTGVATGDREAVSESGWQRVNTVQSSRVKYGPDLFAALPGGKTI
jgi:hypothetical protein